MRRPRPGAAEPGDPLTLAEFRALVAPLGPFEPGPAIAVAASGGPDSSALALLARQWAAEHGGTVCAFVVDHGLRPDSAVEAATAADRLRSCGIATEVLVWHGPKPASGLMAAARDARLALLAGACRRQGILHLMLAHQREEQAETVAMRAARGSGAPGRAGIPAIREVRGVRLLRPLLPVPKTRLIATLRAAQLPWIEDPSNRDPRFHRARLRRAAGLDHDALWQEARRFAVARAVADARTAALMARVARPHRLGFARVDRGVWRELPAAERTALLARLLACIGGQAYPVAGAKVRMAAMRVDQGTMTLGGCIILTRRAELLVCREAGRISDCATLATGDRLLWDGRWELQVARAPDRIELRALGPGGRSALPAAVRAALRRADIPATALEPLPAAWAEGRLLVCPPLAAWEPRRAGAVLITAAFRPTYPLTAAEFGGVNVVSNPQPPIYRREAGSDPASEVPSALSSSGMPGPTSRRAQ